MTIAFGQKSLAMSMKDNDIDGFVLSEIAEEVLLDLVQESCPTAKAAVLRTRVKGYFKKVQEWKLSGVPISLFSEIVNPLDAPSQDG